MADVRWDEWPVVVVEVVDQGAERSNEPFWAVLSEALERSGRFGLIVVKPNVDPGDTRPRSQADLEGMRWLKTARGRIGERCAGIAYVTSEDVLDHEWARRGIAAGPLVYGCPTEGFTDVESARRWLTDALTAAAVR